MAKKECEHVAIYRYWQYERHGIRARPTPKQPRPPSVVKRGRGKRRTDKRQSSNRFVVRVAARRRGGRLKLVPLLMAARFRRSKREIVKAESSESPPVFRPSVC